MQVIFCTANAIKFYPTQVVGGKIVVTLPIGAYPHGVTVALVQPSTRYSALTFTATPILYQDLTATSYSVDYTGTYAMPDGWRQTLVTDGHSNLDTTINLIIRPDARTVCDNPQLTWVSRIFELNGAPVWTAGELRVPLKFSSVWDTTASLDSSFNFSCTLASANFQADDTLRLTGAMILVAGSTEYGIPGNWAPTEMVVPLLTVNFNGNGGTMLPADAQRQARLGQSLGTAMPPNPVRADHAFLGWNTQVNGLGTAFTSATAVTANGLTLYAQWRSTFNLPVGGTAAPIPTLNPAALLALALALVWMAARIRREAKFLN
jgi:uncharacterized repeat protein (TIGR02543 family)